MNLSYDTSIKSHMRLISPATLSTNCLGVTPFSAAFCSTLSPCSSVPVIKNTSKPCARLKRAIASEKTASYVLPMWGLPDV